MCLKATCVKSLLLLNIITDDKGLWEKLNNLCENHCSFISVSTGCMCHSISLDILHKVAFKKLHFISRWLEIRQVVSIHLKAEIQDVNSVTNSSEPALNPLKTKLGNMLGQFWLKTTFKRPTLQMILYCIYILYIKCKIFHWSVHWL